MPQQGPARCSEEYGGGEGGSSASEMRGLCGALWYTVPRRGCPSSLCAFLYRAPLAFFLPRSFLFPPTRRYRQGLACSLASEGNSSVVLGPSRAFGRPARLSWNPGRIRALSFSSAPLFQSLCSQTALERNMLLDSRGEIRKLGARIWRINVIKRCLIGLNAGLVGD